MNSGIRDMVKMLWWCIVVGISMNEGDAGGIKARGFSFRIVKQTEPCEDPRTLDECGRSVADQKSKS